MRTFAPIEPNDSNRVVLRLVRTVNPQRFARCPICLVAPASHKEHVPPKALGGRKMAWTCEPCNHRLGTRLEGPLADWFDGTFYAGFSSEDLPGKRKVQRTRFIATDDGGFVILVDDQDDRDTSALGKMLDAGEFAMEYSIPSFNLSRLALLKSTYLTACLDMGAPPAGVVADRVRRELVSTRDAPTREGVPTSDLALGLAVDRTHAGHHRTPAAVGIAVTDRDEGRYWGALLAGSIFVEFPPGFPVAGINEAP
jgi:hypothetical protein